MGSERARDLERKKGLEEQFNTIYVPIKETQLPIQPKSLPEPSTIIAAVTKTVLQGPQL